MGAIFRKTLLLQYFMFLFLNNYALGKSNTLSTIVEPSNPDPLNGTERISFGLVFDQSTSSMQYLFKMVMKNQVASGLAPEFLNFQLFVDVINTADFFKLSKLVCNQFSRGVVGIMAAVLPNSFGTFHSYANTFHMPFVSPYFPEKDPSQPPDVPDYALSMLPDYHKAILGTVLYYGWKNVIYLYDSLEGMLRLQHIFKSLKPGKSSYFRIANVKKVVTAKDVIVFLRQLEKTDRWTNKYIILDCSAALAKETIVSHVRDVRLGRLNYHYLLSGLVLDEHWSSDVHEFKAINITGFRMIDTSREFVKRLYKVWDVPAIEAPSALMYDSLYLLLIAFQRMTRDKPYILEDLFKKDNQSRFLNCDTEDPIPLKYGEEIMEFIRTTNVEGFSGNISFSSKNIRQNFSLSVMHNSLHGEMLKIATWYDDKGFKAIRRVRNKLDVTGRYYRNKTYTVVSIQEPPYFMSNKPKKIFHNDPEIVYTGFCAELAKMIAEKLEIKIKFRMSADGKYGELSPAMIGGWDGMVGELVRKETDMVIAPLIVTREREAAIEFSRSFLTFNRIHPKPPKGKETSSFSFFQPLSRETWYVILASFILVTFVTYVVARFSPKELQVVAAENRPPDETETEAANKKLTFFGSIWQTLSLSMHRANAVPRAASGRIVCFSWWFFVLVIICSYTAYLTSQLTLLGLQSPMQTAYSHMAQCPEDMLPELKRELTVDNELHGNGDTMEHVEMPESDGYPYVSSTSNCEMLVSVMGHGILDFSVAFPRGSKLRIGVNLALIAIKEEGEMSRLERKYFYNSDCGTQLMVKGAKEMTLADTVGIFYVLLLSLGLSLALAVLEFISYYRSSAARANAPIRAALRAPSRQELNEEQEPTNAIRSRRDLEIETAFDGPETASVSYAGCRAQALCCEMAAPLQVLDEPSELRTRTMKNRQKKSRLQLPVINEQQMIELRPMKSCLNDNSDSMTTSFNSPSRSSIEVMIRPRNVMNRLHPLEVMHQAHESREFVDAPAPYFTPANQMGDDEYAQHDSLTQV